MKYSLSRSVTIEAPIEKVRELIVDFHHWNSWSPWSVCEPDHQVSYEGSPGTVGHAMAWEGELIGSGRIAIEEMDDDEIDFDLRFFKPFKSNSKSGFELEAHGTESTEVTWTMDGRMPFFLGWMIPMMKSWIEMDYDRGLAMLKSMAETGSVPATTTNEGIVEMEGFTYVGKQNSSHMDDLAKDMKPIFTKLMDDMKSLGKCGKHWVCIYPKVSMIKKDFTYICACSDEELVEGEMADYQRGEIQSGKVLKILHKGSYKHLGNAWSMGMMYSQGKKLKGRGKPYEYYYNSPHDTPEEELLTAVCFPVK